MPVNSTFGTYHWQAAEIPGEPFPLSVIQQTMAKRMVWIMVGAGILGVVLGALTAGRPREEAMAAASTVNEVARPAIDRAAPAKTERAVFALG